MMQGPLRPRRGRRPRPRVVVRAPRVAVDRQQLPPKSGQGGRPPAGAEGLAAGAEGAGDRGTLDFPRSWKK